MPKGDNVVVISDNRPVWLVEMGYNTAAKYGPNVVQFDQEFDFLTKHLREYRTGSRPRLLCRYSYSNTKERTASTPARSRVGRESAPNSTWKANEVESEIGSLFAPSFGLYKNDPFPFVYLRERFKCT